jgi:lactoylglutathione lyase
MIRVLDEPRSVAFYDTAFGLRVADRIGFETFTRIHLSNSESGFELEPAVNKGRTEPCNPGDGYGHLAVTVADVGAEHARLTAAGLSPRKLVDFRNTGARVAKFFFIADPDGYQIDVIERGGRFQ